MKLCAYLRWKSYYGREWTDHRGADGLALMPETCSFGFGFQATSAT